MPMQYEASHRNMAISAILARFLAAGVSERRTWPLDLCLASLSCEAAWIAEQIGL
jgi:hypothetical protein